MSRAEAPPVRIAALLRTFPTVSEIFVYRELADLRQQGLPLTVAVVRRKPGLSQTVLQQQASELLGGEVLEVPRAPLYLPMLGAMFRLLRQRRRQTWQALRWGLRHQPFKDVLKGLWLAERFWKDGITLLHIHFAGEAAELGEIIRLAVGIPSVVTLHARDLFVPRPSLPQVLEQAAALVVISAYNQQWLGRYHGPGIMAKSQVIHLGVPEISGLERGEPPPRIDLPGSYSHARPAERPGERPGERPAERPIRLLTVARLVEKKGHTLLLGALARLCARGHRLHLTLVGEGPERSRLTAQASALGVGDRVTFCGSLSQSEVARIYEEGVDLFVLPARVARDGDQEGIPVALMEAMSRGVLVVSTPVSGIPELIRDGVEGFLAQAPTRNRVVKAPALASTDPEVDLEVRLEEALERALNLLVQDEAGGARMRLSAQQIIRNHFHGPSQAAKVKALLEKITTSSSRHGI